MNAKEMIELQLGRKLGSIVASGTSKNMKKHKIPQPLSTGEECFALQCKAYKFTPERQYRFAEGRKYAFDFAFPEANPPLAIEIEGGMWNGGRHVRPRGFEADCEKYNLASSMGWRVMRYTTAMVQRGDAIDYLLRVIWQDEV